VGLRLGLVFEKGNICAPDGNRIIIPTRSPVDVGYVLYYLFIYYGLFNDTH